MADIQYLSYGNLQVEKLALLNLMADSVTTYVNKLPWSRKRKEKFISAYSDMLSRGILGASSDSGQWVVNVNGEIDLDSKSKKDKLMYQEAAWFIRHQMLSLAQDKDKTEENEIVKTPFDFNKDFINYVSKQKFGSNDFKTSQWNEFDERNKYGIRGTEKRMKMLSELLKSYSDNFDESKFDFKDSPYKDSADLKNRIGEAITALGTPDKRDDLEKLYAIGLDPADWFNNGSGDPSGYEINGKELTNGEYYNAIQEAERKKYEEYVRKSKQYIEDLKKRENTINNPVVLSTKLLSKPKTLGLTGFTDADMLELGALVGDITSIIYPGAIGGAVFGTGAASARTAASAMRGDLNFWDRLIDHATGIIGGFPLLGDALMLGKVGKGIRAFIQGHGLLEAFSNTPELSAVSKKLANGEWTNITVDEWKGMLKFFRGLTGAGRVYKSNRSIAETARRSGLEVNNNWWRQASGLGPKITRTSSKYNIKAKVGDKDVTVELENGEYNDLVKNLRKVKPGSKSQEKSQEIIKKAIVGKKEVTDVKPDAKIEDITITYSPSWRRFIPFTGTKSIASNFGMTESKIIGNTMEEFEAGLKDRSTWDKIINGSNRSLRRYRKGLGSEKDKTDLSNSLSNNLSNSLVGVPNSPLLSNVTPRLNIRRTDNIPYAKADMNKFPKSVEEYNNFIESYYGNSVMKGGYGNINYNNVSSSIAPKKVTLNVNGKNYDFELSTGDPSKLTAAKIGEIRKKFAELLIRNKELKDLDINAKATLLREFKKLGWLQQGGRIDKLKIQKYKEYILK